MVWVIKRQILLSHNISYHHFCKLHKKNSRKAVKIHLEPIEETLSARHLVCSNFSGTDCIQFLFYVHQCIFLCKLPQYLDLMYDITLLVSKKAIFYCYRKKCCSPIKEDRANRFLNHDRLIEPDRSNSEQLRTNATVDDIVEALGKSSRLVQSFGRGFGVNNANIYWNRCRHAL